MEDYTTTAFKAREQLSKFLGIFSPHFSKPENKFIAQMVYGMQSSQDVRLASVARQIHGRGTASMKKIIERLERHLMSESLGRRMSEIVAKAAARRVKDDTIIAIDPSDIQKDYAEKMECLAKVWDGSKGRVGDNLGYPWCAAIACDSGRCNITPLHFHLWSAEEEGYRSGGAEVLKVVDAVRAQTGGRGIYVVDRGEDSAEFFNGLIARKLRFIVRLRGDRKVYCWKSLDTELAHAGQCQMRYSEMMEYDGRHGEGRVRKEIQFGVMPLRLPEMPGVLLHMVVVRGFSEKPMMLITNLATSTSRKALWQVVEGYLTRWRIEDSIRWLKQSYGLEGVRMMKLRRIKNLMGILLAVAYFVMVWIAGSVKREIVFRSIIKVSRRIVEVAEFCFYAVSDGLKEVYSRSFRRPPEAVQARSSLQMEFALDSFW